MEDLDNEIQGLVERLDRLVPKAGAHLMIPVDASGTAIVGNRIGYLRLGIEFLKAALQPAQGPSDSAPRVEPNVGYLLAEGSGSPFELCELDESIASRPPVQSRLGPLGQLAAGVLLVALLVLLLIGGAVAWRWVFG